MNVGVVEKLEIVSRQDACAIANFGPGLPSDVYLDFRTAESHNTSPAAASIDIFGIDCQQRIHGYIALCLDLGTISDACRHSALAGILRYRAGAAEELRT